MCLTLQLTRNRRYLFVIPWSKPTHFFNPSVCSLGRVGARSTTDFFYSMGLLHCQILKGTLLSKALTCRKCIHLTQVTLCRNLQFLSTQQCAYQSYLVTSWFDSACITLTHWLNFREKHFPDQELYIVI